jgi:hypothetical protein
MAVSATEWTAQIATTSVAGVGQEPNPTVSAVGHAPPEVGVGRQNSVQSGLVLPDKGGGLLVYVPIRTTREKLGHPNDKKARPSVTM